jgi:gliding motility-associated-like protein
MKLKNLPSIKFKSSLIFPAIILLSGLLLSSQNNLNFLSNAFFADITATISTDKTSVCVDETAIITLEGTGGIAPYIFTYQIDGNLQDAVESNINGIKTITVPSSSVGSFVYKLISVKEKGGSEAPVSVNQEITIKVNAPPVVDFTFNNNNACSGETIQFTDNSSGTGDLTYSWNFGDGSTSTLKNPTHIYDDVLGCGNSVFTVGLEVTDRNGCSKSTSYVINVKQKPDITFSDAAFGGFDNCGNASLSPIYSITVANNSNSDCISSYFIDWGDETTTASASFPASHTYTNTGVFQMKIKTTGDNGCINEVIYQVKNVGSPAGSIASPGNTSNICLGDSELTFPITNYEKNSSDTFYTIDFGDGSPNEIYTQEQIEANNNITHNYLRGSCSEPNGEFIAILSIQNACKTITSKLDSIIILEPSKAQFETDNNSCINKNIIFSNKSIIGDNPSCIKAANFKWDFGDGTVVNDNNTNTTSNQTHSYTNPGTYTVTLSVSSRCGTDIFTKEICIEPKITPTFDVNTDKGCIPLAITTTNTTIESNLCSTTPTYLWTVDYNADNCGNSADWEFTNSTDKNSKNPTFVFNNSGKYTLTQKITTGCGTETTTRIIDVKKPPTATIDAISDACGSFTFNPVATVENCTDDTSGITYNWTFSGGLPASSNTLDPGNITFNSPGIHTVTLEVTSECGLSNKATQSFEIFEIPIITNTDLTQEICSNQSTSEISFITSNASTTYSWSANASANVSGYTPNGNSTTIPVQTLVNNSNTVGTVTYTVIPKINICEGDPVDFTITINPAPKFTTQPASSEICVNGTATTLEVTYENGSGLATYQWFSNTSNINSGGNPITSETNATYNPPTNTVGTLYYYVEITFSTDGCSQITSNTAKVTVVPQLTMDAVAAPQTICIGGSANEFKVTFSGGTGNATYQWFKNNSNTNSGGTAIPSENASTYTPPPFSTAGNFYFYAAVSLDGNGCSLATSDVFQVDVLTDPVIDMQAIASQELCQGAVPTDLIITASGGTTSDLKYKWFKNTNNNTTSGALILGAITNSYTPSTTTAGTFYYYVQVSQIESGCSVLSDVSKLIINEAPIITTQPTSSEICISGTATELEVVYQNGTGLGSYQWFSNSVDNTTSGTEITGETAATFNPPTNAVGETYYYAEISFSSGGCTKITSNTAKVTVAPQLTIDAVVAPQTICIGGTANEFEVTFSGGTGNATYQWFKNNSNTNTGGTKIPSETNSTYTPPPFSTAGNFYFYAEIYLDGNGCSFATSDVFQVDVLPNLVFDSQAIASQELCQGAIPTDLTVSVSGGTTSTKIYQWYKNSTNSTLGGTAILGETANSYKPSTATAGSFYYYVVVSQSESGCSVVSNISLIKVNEAPIFTTQPTSSEICEDETATLLEVAYLNGTGIATYQWFSNTVDDSTSGTEITGETNATYNPLTNVVGTIYYYAEISFSSGGCEKITSNTARVIVNEIPVISSAEITIYSEETFTFDPNLVLGNTVPNGTKYTWSAPTFNPTGAIIGASSATSPQDQISQTLKNTGKTPIKVTYTITPATTKCTGSSFILEVTVNPSLNSNATIVNNNCFESNDGSISTNIDGGIPFSTGNPYIISWIGPNGFTATSATITNLEAGLYTLRIEDKNGISISEELRVTQPAILAITKDVEKNISCFEGNDGAIEVTISGGTNPFTYNWTTTDGSGIVPNSKNQHTLTAGTYILEVVDENNCSTSETFLLTEPKVLKIETISKQDILCFGAATGAISINVIGGTPVEVSPGVFDYTYNWSGPDGFLSSSKNITNLIAGTYTVTVTDELGCTTNIDITLNESPEIIITYTKTDVTCYGETNGAIDVHVTGGKEPYQISWSNLSNGFSLSNLSAATYIATITDGNNCVKQVSIRIEQPIFFIDPTVKPISCNGENDGAIDLNLTGGISPIKVIWDDDASAGVQRNNLKPGTYKVRITDSDTYQCPIEQTFIFTNPPAIAVSSTVTDAIDCEIANSGSIDITVSGGTKPFKFLWNTGETSEDLENIPQGDYSVAIEDANGCSVTKQFSIFRQDPIEIEFTESLITDCETKTISKKVVAKTSGGFLPHTLSWSAGVSSGTNNEVMTTTQKGTYVLTVTDNNGCVQTKSILIDEIPTIGDPDFRYSAFAFTTYNFLSIEDPIQFTNLTTGNYTNISWDFGDGSPFLSEENPTHTYDAIGNYSVKLTVEYEAGCTYIIERNIEITIGYKLINPNAFTPNGDGYNETIRPIFTGFTEIEMNIYNTWGTLVYTEKGTSLKGWDGTINNTPAENGNYIMVVNGITFYKKNITTSTPVTLLK